MTQLDEQVGVSRSLCSSNAYKYSGNCFHQNSRLCLSWIRFLVASYMQQLQRQRYVDFAVGKVSDHFAFPTRRLPANKYPPFQLVDRLEGVLALDKRLFR